MRVRKLIAIAAALLALEGTAWAADDEPVETLDLTMRLMPENANAPEAVTRVIELPAAAAAAAREPGASGVDQANAAREQRESGLEKAEAAREQSRERAQENREELGRGPPESAGRSGNPRGNRPDNPGPPATPDPPGN